MNQPRNERGTVVQIHAYGALVRLESGDLASMSAGEVGAHRARLERSIQVGEALEFVVTQRLRRLEVRLIPVQRDEKFEEQIARFLQSSDETGESAPKRRPFVRRKSDSDRP
ncbi:MAG TPA: hypothetical protein VMV73_04530 [Candidatus Dormibacteraeota bacterium]|nr:hypothetical protein [Candidatus Dormibacteraeota bacterium]